MKKRFEIERMFPLMRGNSRGCLFKNSIYKSTHPNLPSQGKELTAFTLAEVLITLGIIGVVAAITIPTLITNYQNKSYSTAKNVFEKKLEEALKVMNTQQALAGYTSTKEFVDTLSQHMVINKVCTDKTNLLNCFADKVMFGVGDIEPKEVDMSTIQEAKDFGQKEWGTDLIGIMFANGTNALIAYNPECVSNPYSNELDVFNCLAILYDTNSFSSPNTSAKDLRSINVTKLGKGNCAITVGNSCFGTPTYAEPLPYDECMKVKDDLGINNCCNTDGCNQNGGDFWAGAVKLCGGVKNMPTDDQITELASYLYDASINKTGKTEGLTLDSDKVNALGYLSVTESDYYFYVWTGVEKNNYISNSRSFYKTYSNMGNSYRKLGNRLTVCLE